MSSGTRTVCTRRLNKGFNFELSVGYPDDIYLKKAKDGVQQQKHCDNNKDEYNIQNRVNNIKFKAYKVIMLCAILGRIHAPSRKLQLVLSARHSSRTL